MTTTTHALTPARLPAPSWWRTGDVDPLTLDADDLALYRAGMRDGRRAAPFDAGRVYALAVLSAAASWPLADVEAVPDLDPTGLVAGTPATPDHLGPDLVLPWEYAHVTGDDALADALAAGDPLAREWTDRPDRQHLDDGWADVRRHVALSAYLAHVAHQLDPVVTRRAALARLDAPDTTPPEVAARIGLAVSSSASWHRARLDLAARALDVRDGMGAYVRTLAPRDVSAATLDSLAERARWQWCADPSGW